jgi:hypothetical protein
MVGVELVAALRPLLLDESRVSWSSLPITNSFAGPQNPMDWIVARCRTRGL